MKKKLAKLCIFLLSLSLLLGGVPAQAAESKTMRVGLCYGDGAMAAAKLSNVEGSGYRFGCYDDELNFTPLGWTDETEIDVLITQNLYLKDSGSYSYSSENNRGAVGCYHIHLPEVYEDFETAQTAAQAVEGGFVAWIEGAYCVRLGAYPQRSAAEEAAAALGVEGACLGETSGYGYSVVAHGTTRVLFQFDSNAAGQAGAFGVLPGLEEGGSTVTAFGGNKYRGAFRFERINGGESTVVNLVDLEDYVKGIVPYEMSAAWPLEALKAQAVCARTYSLGRNKHGGDHFDLCTTTDCQVYRGVARADENSDRAVDETAGQLARYDGKLIDAVYFSSDGGATEDVKNVWGTDHPYLKGKEDPYEADIADKAGNYRWTKTWTAAQLKERFHAKGYLCGDIVSFTAKQSPLGNTIEVKVVDAAGKSYTVSRADRVRSLMGVNSVRFTVETSSGGAAAEPGYAIAGAKAAPSLEGLYALGGDGTAVPLEAESYVITDEGVRLLEPVTEETAPKAGGETTYTLKGTGWGHNVGLSQWGAYAMAKRGYTYLEILNFYYTDITVG